MTHDFSSKRRSRPAAVGSERRRLGFESLEERRLLVVNVAGTLNNDAASLASYGGPGDPGVPGFDNVGRGSTGGSSVVYLGNSWVLTANHVTLLNPPDLSPGGVTFGNTTYLIDFDTVHRLHNPDSSLADLKIFKIIGEPDLPTILPSYIASAPPDVGEHVFMIGNGLSPGDQHFWSINTGPSPWVWTETSEPPVAGPNDVSGFDLESPRRILWGENNVDTTNVFTAGVWGYVTQFDDIKYTGVPSLTYEAQASVGDSGGPAFYFDNGKWLLSGMMITVSANLSGQPSSTTLLGFQTLLADLSVYRDEILEIAGVMGRHVFYNNSTFSGLSTDSAIATDKFAYLPGDGVAGPDNATSYSNGINGIMVDLATDHGPLSLDDFSFRVGANNTPSTWAAAPTPTGFTVRPGEGEGGSDRVEIVWADGAIVNTWLEVTVEGNDTAGGLNTNTGLAASDVFYFGNKIGDTFSDGAVGFFNTDATDEIEARNNSGIALEPTNVYDFNRDAFVDASDQIIARNNAGFVAAIDIADPPPAPAPDDDSADSAIAFALADTSTNDAQPRDVPFEQSLPLPAADEPRASRDRVFEQLAIAQRGQWKWADREDTSTNSDASGSADESLDVAPDWFTRREL